MPGNGDVECSEESDEFRVVFVVILGATFPKGRLGVISGRLLCVLVNGVLEAPPGMKQRQVELRQYLWRYHPQLPTPK